MNDLAELKSVVEQQSAIVAQLMAQIRRRIIGQATLLERMLIGVLTGGHILLEGVPGLAKTLAVKTLAESLDLSFRRVQFTPDLLPADLIGTMVYDRRTGDFVARKGPIFANIILADEINRAPAKVQSALLEAMQERQVTIGDSSYILPEPFLVLATQNPIEQEGTYQLPEAQVDRFMLKVRVDYPARHEERKMMDLLLVQESASGEAAVAEAINVERVLSWQQLRQLRSTVNRIYVDERIRDYCLDLVMATRKPAEYKMKELAQFIRYGASPRASVYLVVASRTLAYLRSRAYVIPEDVKAICADVLRHRICLSYEAEAEQVTQDDIIKKLLERVPVP
ncbi:MAG: AAA family ATPase [Acidobacteriota bacterium]|nr:AAA family ATPase [Blastocatellia bacterium]MDW8412434.1 AAA family ATPase [Acidobacteriota bacterium]